MSATPPLELEVTRLMCAAKHGDGAAFDQLVLKLRGMAFHVAFSLVSSREDALDLVQESLLKVYAARASFREGEPFLPWFHRILRNTCFSFLRKARGLKLKTLSGFSSDQEEAHLVAFEIKDPAPPVGSTLERRELGAQFREALGELNSIDREILVLRHYSELSYKQIAAHLGLKEGTVMSRLFHARRRLRERLAPQLEELISSVHA